MKNSNNDDESDEIDIDIDALIENIHGKKKEDSHNIYWCEVCKKETVTVVDGEVCCINNDCGAMYGPTIDESLEMKQYSNEIDVFNSSQAIDPLLPQHSYSTSIGSYSGGKLSKMNTWCSVDHYERSLKENFDKISYYCKLNYLPQNIVDYAKILYNEAYREQTLDPTKKISRGTPKYGLIAACIYHACKEYKIHRAPKEIAEMNEIKDDKVKTSDVNEGSKLLEDLLKNSKVIDLYKSNLTSKYSDYIGRYCKKLKINDDKTLEYITKISKKSEKLNILSNNTPQTKACTYIYYVICMLGNENIKKSNIIKETGLSDTTITKTYEKLIKFNDKLLD